MQDAPVGSPLEPIQNGIESPEHAGIEGVNRWPVERDGGDAIGDAEIDGIGHALRPLGEFEVYWWVASNSSDVLCGYLARCALERCPSCVALGTRQTAADDEPLDIVGALIDFGAAHPTIDALDGKVLHVTGPAQSLDRV